MIKHFSKYLLLINSLGNKKHKEQIKQFVYTFFEDELKNKNLIIEETVNEFSSKKLSKTFSDNYDNSLIISAGGDGTIHEIINSINFEKTSLAILPNGTGNDFATHLYKGMNLEHIISNFHKGNFRKTDLIKINDFYCMNITSFGYETAVLKKSLEFKKKYPFLGNQSFKFAIPFTLSSKKAIEYSYLLKSIDSEIITGQGSYLLSAICNGSRFGGGFTPAPNASIEDSVLEFNQIEDLGIIEMAMALPKYKDGSHITKVPKSHNYRIVSGSITPTIGSLQGNIDGELYEFEKIDFEIMPKAINLLHL